MTEMANTYTKGFKEKYIMAYTFSEEWIEEVRAGNDIADVISEYVSLKSGGKSLLGLCPFHTEKTPSFNVNLEKQFYYCFGCQEGGNVIHFIMNIEKINFVDSLKFLAERAHIPIPDQDNFDHYHQNRILKDRIYEIGKEAAHYYHQLLLSIEGKAAIQYLYDRGIADVTIRKFGLGYSGEKWNALMGYLIAKGFTLEELLLAGVIIDNKDKKYDRFRNRIMFPIINIHGKVIGFGGRVLNHSNPKYLNSPETIVFNKSLNLYGFNLINRKQMMEKMIVVEGYMDVISLHQHGVKNVVATLGTSLTQEQAKLLCRSAHEIYIAYDGDAAGQKATIRGMDILRSEGCKVKIISFPDNMDPDEFIRNKGIEGFQEQIMKAHSFIEYQLNLIKLKYDLMTQEGRTQYAIECSEILAQIDNPVECDVYSKRIQVETGFTGDVLHQQIMKAHNTTRVVDTYKNKIGNNRYTKGRVEVNTQQSAHRKAEKNILSILIQQTNLLPIIKERLAVDAFSDPAYRKLAHILYANYNETSQIAIGEILNKYEDQEEAKKIADIFSNTFEYDNISYLIDDWIKEIESFHIEEKIRSLQEEFNDIHIDKERRIQITMEIQSFNLLYKSRRN